MKTLITSLLLLAIALILGFLTNPAGTATVLAVAALCGAAVFIVANTCRLTRRSGLVAGLNTNPANWGTHAGSITKLTDAAVATRYLVGKFGSDVDHIAVCGASDEPLGIITDESAGAEEPVNVAFLGAQSRTLAAVASEAIAITDELYTAANGQVQNLPAAAGTYYKIGKPIRAAGSGEVVEFVPCYPVAVVVES
jgi:hypothetical protein